MVYAHENNFKNKIEQNYHNLQEKLNDFFNNKYLKTKKKLLIKCKDVKHNYKAISILINDYLSDLKRFSKENGVNSQSKLSSSFLEEINSYLFMELPEIKSGKLSVFNKGVYTGMKIKDNLKIFINKKDVDFCIGKRINITIDNSSETIIFPIVAVEVKTYLDATMLGEVQFSCKKLKESTPDVKTYVLMETNQVAQNKLVSAKNDNFINDMFVLKECEDDPISAEVLIDYYNEVCECIKNIGNDVPMNIPGRLFNRS